MSVWIGKAVFVLGLAVFIAIRVPFDNKRKQVKIVESRKDATEIALMGIVGLGCFFLPILFVASALLSFADHDFELAALVAGLACLIAALWLFHRSHADLDTNWSPTLELREGHEVVQNGVYRHIRHPMYASFFLYGVAQALLLPNWVAGPAFFVAFGLMFLFRLHSEENMMLEKFGRAYEDYRLATKRLIPGIW